MTVRAVVLGMIGLATLFAAANVGVGWLYALGFLFLTFLLLAFLLAGLALRRVRVLVHVPPWATVGEGCELQLTLEAPSGRAFLGLLGPALGSRSRLRFFRGRLMPEGWGHTLIPELAPATPTLVRLTLPTPSRGVHAVRGLALQVPAYGLGAVHRALAVTPPVIVRPRIHVLPALPWLVGEEADTLPDRHLGGGGAELIRSIRDYRPGDPLRAVHWRSTARTGQLRIKETESELSSGAWAIALDLAPGPEPDAFEHAVSLAASLCAHAHGRAIPVRLMTQAGAPASQGLEAQLDWLATVTPDPTARPYLPTEEDATVYLTARPAGVRGARYQLVAGAAAPLGAIACPPDVDPGRVLGRAVPWR